MSSIELLVLAEVVVVVVVWEAPLCSTSKTHYVLYIMYNRLKLSWIHNSFVLFLLIVNLSSSASVESVFINIIFK